MEYKQLSEIADVQSGLVLSRKEAVPDSETATKYKQLNLRSVREDGTINVETLQEFCSEGVLSEQFIGKENDIVMRLFAPLQPVMITQDISGFVVPSQFAIIRMKSQKVLPAFLSYYLSQANVLSEMAIMDSGQAARGIKLSTLSDIRVPLLSLTKQQRVVDLAETHRKRKKLYLELILQYDMQADVVIKGVIGGEKL